MYIIIVGAGEVGYNLAKMLCYEKHDVVLIEQDQQRLKRAQDNLDIQVIAGSGLNCGRLGRLHQRNEVREGEPPGTLLGDRKRGLFAE